MIEKRIFDWAIWFIAGCLLLILLTSCAPTFPTALPSPAGTPPAEEVVTATHTVSGCTITTGIPDGYLNVRTGPGTQYSVITTLSEGTKVFIWQTKDGWYQINLTVFERGWINSKYCKE